MKNNFIDKLGVTNLKSGLITIGSSVNTGRTTLLSVVAAEFYHDGKNVLFITQELDEKSIMQKIRKSLLGLPPNLNFCSLKIKRLPSPSTLKYVLQTQFAATNYDVVIIDTFLGDLSDYEFLRELSQDKNCVIMNGIQRQNNMIEADVIKFIPSKSLFLSDMVINMDRVNANEPSFWVKLKYFLCFWLKKPVPPNRTLKILKNRFGEQGVNIDINIDFEKVKIK